MTAGRAHRSAPPLRRHRWARGLTTTRRDAVPRPAASQAAGASSRPTTSWSTSRRPCGGVVEHRAEDGSAPRVGEGGVGVAQHGGRPAAQGRRVDRQGRAGGAAEVHQAATLREHQRRGRAGDAGERVDDDVGAAVARLAQPLGQGRRGRRRRAGRPRHPRRVRWPGAARPSSARPRRRGRRRAGGPPAPRPGRRPRRRRARAPSRRRAGRPGPRAPPRRRRRRARARPRWCRGGRPRPRRPRRRWPPRARPARRHRAPSRPSSGTTPAGRPAPAGPARTTPTRLHPRHVGQRRWPEVRGARRAEQVERRDRHGGDGDEQLARPGHRVGAVEHLGGPAVGGDRRGAHGSGGDVGVGQRQVGQRRRRSPSGTTAARGGRARTSR